MTDSYHFESVAKFRVGGVYRDGVGRIYLLREAGGEKLAVASQWESDACEFDRRGELHRLDNGRFDALDFQESHWHLIPGEMIQRDGEWVAADAPIVFPSGAAVLTSGDKIVGRVEAQPEPISLGAILRRALDRLVVPAPAPEPIRPALDWNTTTPHDTFGADFIVTKGAVEAPTTHSPTTDSAYPAIAGLLRVSDGGPANASASLLLKTA